MARTQFVVPQFIDVEPRILGPITARQFLLMLGVVLVDFIAFRLAPSWLVLLSIVIPLTLLGIVFAFVKVNGQPFHYIALNMVQTMRKPATRVWDKRLSDTDLQIYLKKPDVVVAPKFVPKPPLASSRLAELTLIVDTGGVYQSDESQQP